MCIVFIKDYYTSNAIFFSLFSVVTLVAVWLLSRKILLLAIVSAIVVSFFTVYAVKVKRKIENIQKVNFYLVEDVVIDFKKKFAFGKHRSGYDYIYTFKKYGKHAIHKSAYPTKEVFFRKEKNATHLPVAETAIQSCEAGDMFYLLILEEQGFKKIIKCFYKVYYGIENEDFDYIEEKYYCKSIDNNDSQTDDSIKQNQKQPQ